MAFDPELARPLAEVVWEDFWKRMHLADGRVDTAKKVGTLAFADVDDRLVRRIAEDVIAAFPGIKFWVFRGDDWGVPMQQFWESVAR